MNELEKWQKLSQQQRIALNSAVGQLKKLKEAVVAYGSKYGFVTETMDGEVAEEGVELFNQSGGFRPPGKVKRFTGNND